MLLSLLSSSLLYLSPISLAAPTSPTFGLQTFLSPHDIQGINFISPYINQAVNVSGIVTAKSSVGIYIQSQTPDNDDRTSEGLYIYGSAGVGAFAKGDLITLSCTVQECEYHEPREVVKS